MKCQLILTLRTVGSGGMSLFQKHGRPHQLDHTLKGQLTLHCRFAFRSNAWRCDKNDKPGKLSGRQPAEEKHYLWASLTHLSTWSALLPLSLAAAKANGSRALNSHKAC